MTALEELGVCLLIGGVRATHRDARRKHELRRERVWAHVLTLNSKLCRYVELPIQTVDSITITSCTASCADTSGQRVHCNLDAGHEGNVHLSSAGIAFVDDQ